MMKTLNTLMIATVLACTSQVANATGGNADEYSKAYQGSTYYISHVSKDVSS